MRRLRINCGFPGRWALVQLGLLAWLGVAASSGWGQANFNSAQAITGPWGSVTNDNTGIVPDKGGPSPAGFVPQHPLWYKWTAPESGEVTFDTLGSADTNGVTLDTVVAVYNGPNISQLLQVAANDDYYPFVHEVYSSMTRGGFYQTFGGIETVYPPSVIGNPINRAYLLPFNGPSIVRFNATAGTTYYIEVDCTLGKGYSRTGIGQSVSVLSQVAVGPIALNWAFRPSGALRFASEEVDFNSQTPMPAPLYQCTEWESLFGLGYSGGETMHDTYYQYDPEGLLVTVTRVAGSRGRLLVDYATADITNTVIGANTLSAAVGGVDYAPISGTLVFDDFEMSKTLVIPILTTGRNYCSTNNPFDRVVNPGVVDSVWNPSWIDKDFKVVLSNPRLDAFETTNVSPPRLDTPFSTATVRILSMAGLGSDPDQNKWEDKTPAIPSHDVYNFGKKNYRVPRDVNNYFTTVQLGVMRTHWRLNECGSGDNGAVLNYRINGSIGNSVSPQNWNNFFALNPGSEYAIPNTNNACNWIFPYFFPWGGTNAEPYPAWDYTLADGTVTIPNTGEDNITFTVRNDRLTKFNKDFNVVLFRHVGDANYSVGENNECHVTILFDDTAPPAGSVDEFYNTDFGNQMKPPVATVPSNQPRPGTDGEVWALAVQPDNKAIVAGQFTTYNGTTRSCIARATASGPIDATFNPGSGANGGMISSLALLPDSSGKMMIGGTFLQYNGADRKFIARVNPNGLRDGTFAPTQDPDGPVWALAVQTNNQVIIAGDFTMIGEVPRAHIARYNADGSLDLGFDPGTNAPDDTVLCVAVQPDGKVVIGGQFANLGSKSLSGLARLNADGSVDVGFNANLGFGVDGIVYTVVIQGGAQIVLGGEFQNVGIAQRTRIARLNSDGTVDNTFNSGTGADDTVFNISAQLDGSMYVGGLFTMLNGTHRLGLARLYPDGTIDTGFLDTAYNQFAGLHRKYYDRQWNDPINPDPNPDPRPAVYASQVLPNGNVVIGGSFQQVGGGQADASIRFDSDYPSSTMDTNVWTEPKSRDGVRNRSNFARLVGGSTPGPGNIGLLYNNYSVNKRQLSLDVDIIRTNGTLGYATANFAVQPGLAQSGTDYVYNSAPPLYLSSWWPDGDLQPWYSTTPHAVTRAHSDGFFGTNGVPIDVYGHTWAPYAPGNLTLTIKNSGVPGSVDTQVQMANPSGADQFFLGGQNIPLGNALGVSAAPLTIVDDAQSSGTVGLASANFYVNEGGTNATIILTRTNGTAGFPSVVLSTFDGTGMAGSNYVTYSKRLTFSPGATSLTNREIRILDDGIREPNGLTVGLRLTGVSGATLGLSTATLNIVDNDYDPGYVTFSSANYATNKNSGAAILTVNRFGANKGALTLQCITTNGSAISGVNYTGVTNTLVWTNLESSPRYVVVPLTLDGVISTNRTFGAYLTNAIVSTTNAPYVLAGTPTATTVTIVNDDYYGSLQFSAASYQASENGGHVTIPVIRTGGSAQTLTVNFATINGPMAFTSTNYVATNNTMTFGPGEVAKTFDVTILDDGLTNGPPFTNFYFTVNLSATTPSGMLGSQSSARVYIVDAEYFNYPAGAVDTLFTPNPGFNGDVYSVAMQTNGQIVAVGAFTVVNNFPRNHIVRLNADSSIDTTFLNGLVGANGPIQTVLVQSDGRILAGGPFTKVDNLNRNGLVRLMSDGTLDSSFNAGAGGDNTVFALAETFMPDRRLLIGGSFLNMNGSSHSGLARLNNAGVLDSTFNPTLNINGTVYAIAVYPTNTTQGGKILIGGSFTSINGFGRNGIARLNPDGTLDTRFDPGTGAADAVRALAIQLDGRVLVGGSFTNFNGSSLNHIARLNINGQVDTSFNVGAGADDTVDAIVLQPDARIVLAGLFTHANGVFRNRITRLLPDGTVDPAINFGLGADAYINTVALQPDGMMVIGGGFTSYDGASRQHLARIYGGSLSGSGTFQFTAGDFRFDENATNAVLSVRRQGGTAGNMSVDFTTVALTAVPGVNYSNVQATLHFPPGETLQSVQVPVIDDFTITPDLVVSNYLSNPSPPSGFGVQSWALLTILNVDSTVSFSSLPYAVWQNDPSGAFFVEMSRLGSTRGSATVDFFTTTNGTAVAGVDYTSISNTLIFQPGITKLQVRIPILNSPLMINDTTVTMQLSNTVNTLLAVPSEAALTIQSTNASPGRLMFSQTNYVVGEADGLLPVTIIRTNGRSGVVSVNFGTLPGTAVPGLKYAATNGSITFQDKETSKTIGVPILQTTQYEGNQTFAMVLSNATGGARIIGPASVPATIVDDEVGLTFSAPFYLVPETAGTVSVAVQRQNGTSGVTTVQYSTTTNGTAVAGVNYTPTNGVLTFQVGDTVKSFLVQVLHDTDVTGDVSFGLNLSSPSVPALLGTPSSATVVLSDVEAGISLANTNLSMVTNGDVVTTYANYGVLKSSGTNLLITVLRSNVNTGTVGVDYATADGAAIAGADYVASSGSLIFTNGQVSQTLALTIITNRFIQGDRTFTLSLTNPTPTNVTQLLTPYVASITITDDIAGLSFSSSQYSVNENAGSVTINVLRSNYTNSTVSVDFLTSSDGTGRSGVNYYPTNGTLVFTNGETVKQFSVLVVDNHILDGGHTVPLHLTNAVGNALVTNPKDATLTIAETDGSLVIPAGVALISESGPTNGVIDPGELVTLLFGLRNANGTNTSSLVATLLATNGVTNPSGATNYGSLVAHGPSASRPFSFTASGTNGQTLTATLQLRDGSSVLSNAVFTFILGKMPVTVTNNAAITINDFAIATPYPSVINVSNLNGLVTETKVTLVNLSHTYPKDIDTLLVSPTGQKTYLMAHCGDQLGLNNVTLTFDDATNSVLPYSAQITNGTYRPTSYAFTPPSFPVPPAPFPTNATTPPFMTNLSSFANTSPNGMWSLYVFDDSYLNFGSIANGWILSLSVSGPVPGAADLAVGMFTPPTNFAGGNITYTITVTNFGPSSATNVVVSDPLPVGTAFVSAIPMQGAVTNQAGVIVWSVGAMAKDAAATLTLVLQATNTSGTITNSVTGTTATPDPNSEDNTASVVSTVVAPTADLALGLVDSPDPVATGYNLTYSLTVTNLGPATAPGVMVVETLPPTVSFVSASPSNYATNTVAGRLVVTFFNLGNVASNQQVEAMIVVKPTAAGTLINSATCSSGVIDPRKANNNSSVKTIATLFQFGMSRNGRNLTFSWPAEAANAYLEFTTNLRPPSVWAPATNPPSLVGGQTTVTLPIGSGNQFFRVHGTNQ